MAISPTFIQDQVLLRNFYLMPEGVWGRLRPEVVQNLQAAATSRGWGGQNCGQYRFCRVQDQLRWRRENESGGKIVLDFNQVPAGRSLSLSLAFASTFAFAFASAFAFPLVYDEVAPPSAPEIPHVFDGFCATNSQLLASSRAEGFQIGLNESLLCAGRIQPDGTVDLSLHGLDPATANHILALLRRS